MAKVFVSYSVEEEEFVKQISESLKNAGVVVSGEFYPGQFGPQMAAHDIDESDYVLGVLSRQGISSPWVNQELGYAAASGKPLLLLVESGAPVSGLLSGMTYIQFDKADPWTAIDKVSGAIAKGTFNSLRF